MKAVTQPRALETREKILQAAARLIALKGFHDTKLEEVLESAQVTKGAFFHHFRDREEGARPAGMQIPGGQSDPSPGWDATRWNQMGD